VSAVDSTSSILNGRSEITMNGKAAAFGGRMMNSVADQILKQFADNFAARVRESAQKSAQKSDQSSVAASSSTESSELNGLALVWAVIRNWLRGVFGRNST
jgi:hypothetical protein